MYFLIPFHIYAIFKKNKIKDVVSKKNVDKEFVVGCGMSVCLEYRECFRVKKLLYMSCVKIDTM